MTRKALFRPAGEMSIQISLRAERLCPAKVGYRLHGLSNVIVIDWLTITDGALGILPLTRYFSFARGDIR